MCPSLVGMIPDKITPMLWRVNWLVVGCCHALEGIHHDQDCSVLCLDEYLLLIAPLFGLSGDHRVPLASSAPRCTSCQVLVQSSSPGDLLLDIYLCDADWLLFRKGVVVCSWVHQALCDTCVPDMLPVLLFQLLVGVPFCCFFLL